MQSWCVASNRLEGKTLFTQMFNQLNWVHIETIIESIDQAPCTLSLFRIMIYSLHQFSSNHS